MRRFLCSHSTLSGVREGWGEAWRCDVCGQGWVWWNKDGLTIKNAAEVIHSYTLKRERWAGLLLTAFFCGAVLLYATLTGALL